MNRYLSSRLAAQAGIRQVQSSILADAAARSVDRAAGTVWASLLRSIRHRPHNVYHVANDHVAAIVPAMAMAIRSSLNRIAQWGYRQTFASLSRTLPLSYLRVGAAKRITESHLLENRARSSPGLVTLSALGFGFDDIDDQEEPAYDDLDDDAKREAFLAMLFPSPSIEETNEIIYAPVAGRTWLERLEGATRTSASPAQLASTVAIGFSQGKTAQQIARDLLPIVDGVRSTARRIARTESLRVSHDVQMNAWDGLGDLCVGYQIHATLDQHTRPAHAARNGMVFYKEPKPGQKGLDEMPRPPLEADGSIAWNCRCHNSPVLAPNREIQDDPDKLAIFTTAEDRLVPDPLVYSEWFDRAPQHHRETAVGVRRYKAMTEIVGDSPAWELFIDPEDGGIMPLNRLKAESATGRADRLAAVRQQMGQRREMLRKALLLGWVD